MILARSLFTDHRPIKTSLHFLLSQTNKNMLSWTSVFVVILRASKMNVDYLADLIPCAISSKSIAHNLIVFVTVVWVATSILSHSLCTFA